MINYGFRFSPAPGGDDSCSGFMHLWIADSTNVTCTIPTSYAVRYDEWDPVTGLLVITGNSTGRDRRLTEYTESMSRNLRLVESIVRDLERSAGYVSAGDVADAYKKAVEENRMLGRYAKALAEDFTSRGRPNIAKLYQTSIRRFVAFNGGRDLEMERITSEVMREFQQSLCSDGASWNTISFYMRNLRAIYNRAVTEGLVPRLVDSPFDEVYTKIVLTPKTAEHPR